MKAESLYLPLGGQIDPPFRHESATSKAAAEAVKPHQSRLQRQVYTFLLQRGLQGATIEEISDCCGMAISSVCGRIRELVQLGYAKDSDETRANRSGCQATIWVAT